MLATRSRRAFSLIELVIVVVIIGIIGAIAIPRMSRGAEGAADNALRGNLAVLRNALELYAAEHEGTYPTASNVVDQLTSYTDVKGNVTDDGTRKDPYIFGPYLKEVPPLPVGDNKGATGISDSGSATSSDGWIYEVTNGVGEIHANTTTEADASGTLYKDY